MNIPNLSPSKELCYILGVLYGDGYVTIEHRNKSKGSDNYKIGLAQCSKEFSTSFAKALQKIGLKPKQFIKKPAPPGKKMQFVTYVQSVIFFKWFKHLKFKGVESFIGDKKNFILEFIRGYYESDGRITYYQPKYLRIDFYSHSKNIILLIRKYLIQLGYTPYIYKRLSTRWQRVPKNCWILRLYGNSQIKRFISTIRPVIKKEANRHNENIVVTRPLSI